MALQGIRRGDAQLADGAVVRGVHVSAITVRDEVVPLKSLFHLSFDQHDHSLYIRPTAPTGTFRVGTAEIPAGAPEHTASFGPPSTTPVKLSIHERGQVHVNEDTTPPRRKVAGPLFGPPLGELRDKHVFSVSIDSFDVLADLDHEPTKDPPEVDFGFPFFEHTSGRVAIWVNAFERKFIDTTLAATVTLDRGDGRVLYVGMAGVPQEPQGDPPRGLTVIAGWNPLVADDEALPQPFLFVRAE